MGSSRTKLGNQLGNIAILTAFILSSQFGSSVWKRYVVDCFSQRTIVTLGFLVYANILTAILYSFFFVVDLAGAPLFIAANKVQADVAPASSASYKKVLPLVLFNTLVTNSLMTLMVFMLPSALLLKTSVADIPSPPAFVVHTLASVLILELTLGGFHLLVHHPKVYRYVHKIHHEFTAPMAMAATYAHPVDHFFVNLMPTVLGPLLLQSHMLVQLCSVTIIIASTACNHSGYWVPGWDPLFHDYHHLKFNVNFGVGVCLDWFLGTLVSNEVLEKRYFEQIALVPRKNREE
ncbi:Chromosome 5 4 [Entophlyctis sp. JEL0112]|nr:Chromosome 5 4 [Entophlyctis sp. JEL0112]